MPVVIHEVFKLEGEAFSNALRAALDSLPEEEAKATLDKLREADLIEDASGPDMD